MYVALENSSFNESCVAGTSGLSNIPPDDFNGATIIYTAKMDIYGYAPGGPATVSLKTTDNILLDTLDITVNPPPPSGDLSASKTTIDIGEEIELRATNLLNVGAHVSFVLSGSIHSDPYCPDGPKAASDGAVGTIGGTATLTAYGCVPGGSATIELRSSNAVLDTLMITVNPPPEYAELIPPPGPGFYCRFPLGLARTKWVDTHSEPIRSYCGYVHSGTVEIWEALAQSSDRRPNPQRCVETRITNESTQGADLSSWTGTLYDIQPKVMTPEVDLEALMRGELVDFIALFHYPDPKNEEPIRELGTSCVSCRGGTIQSDQHLVDGAFIRHSIIHVFSQHTFAVGSWSETINLSGSHIVSPRNEGYQTYFQSLINEIIGLIGEYAMDKLTELARWILMQIQG